MLPSKHPAVPLLGPRLQRPTLGRSHPEGTVASGWSWDHLPLGSSHVDPSWVTDKQVSNDITTFHKAWVCT